MTISQKKYARKLYIVITLIVIGLLALGSFLERRVSFLSGGLGTAGMYVMIGLMFMMFFQKTADWSPSVMNFNKRELKPFIMGAVSALLIAGTGMFIPDRPQPIEENILRLLIILCTAFGEEFYFRVYGAYIFGGTNDMGVNDYIFSALVYGAFSAVRTLIGSLGSGLAGALLPALTSFIIGSCAGLMLMSVYARTDSALMAIVINLLYHIGTLMLFNSSGRGLGYIGIGLSFFGCAACLFTGIRLIPGNVRHYSDHD